MGWDAGLGAAAAVVAVVVIAAMQVRRRRPDGDTRSGGGSDELKTGISLETGGTLAGWSWCWVRGCRRTHGVVLGWLVLLMSGWTSEGDCQGVRVLPRVDWIPTEWQACGMGA